jgi:cation:H+ antiporter
MLDHVSLFLLGLIILMAGAESLIRGSVRIAQALGVSPFIIGFTLIGFGTSTPELVISLLAALRGSSDIAVGNVVGSNIANVGLVLGIAVLVRPIAAHMRLLKVEVPLVIVVSVLLWVLCRDQDLSRLDGGLLLVGFALLAGYTYRSARREPAEVQQEVSQAVVVHMRVWVAGVLVVVGLAGLIGGAQFMVESAVAIARELGVSEWLIGLTVVAVGTSLPEVAAAVAAAWRSESDLVLGNVVGSNLFNILLILGATAALQPMAVSEQAVAHELPVMVGFAVLLFALVANGLRLYRWEGAILLAAYAGFIGWQVTTSP